LLPPVATSLNSDVSFNKILTFPTITGVSYICEGAVLQSEISDFPFINFNIESNHGYL